MARAVAFIFLIIAVATISAAPNCGVNEVFDTCGSTCPSTCQHPTPLACTLACIPGCRCLDGHVKNAQNQCILLQNC